jgi:glycerol-3-phosphate dehydrogenase
MNTAKPVPYDLAIIGGGINGCGIARDAAGRGLRVYLAERDDLAAHTSSWSSKLIHGGLRYLENYQLRLVRESLKEREVIRRIAPHLTRPLEFVIPHSEDMRPAWMLQMGLFLYDRLGGATTLPRSHAVRFPDTRYGAALAPRFAQAFVYSDLQVDDARLTLANAVDARDRGARIEPRTEVISCVPNKDYWTLSTRANPVDGVAFGDQVTQIDAKVVVNAAGPWAMDVRDRVMGRQGADGLRWIRGSHVVVPRVQIEPHAYLTQQPDGRVVFILPFLDQFTLIGTTDVAVTDVSQGETASPEEVAYLLACANRYLARPLEQRHILWAFAGVRPLYDDGNPNASKVTRDYVMRLDVHNALPVLHIYGGKLTTYRRLSEHALASLQRYLPTMTGAWTHSAALPGGDIESVDLHAEELAARLPDIPVALLTALVRRHGSRAARVLGKAQTMAALGRVIGHDLTEREVAYMVDHEWATTEIDVLWRRSKAGLGLHDNDVAAVRILVARQLAERTLSQRRR